VASAINATTPGAAVSAGGDVADEECVRGLIEQATSTFGPVDLYFANAGITGTQGLAASEDVWDQVLDVNLRAHIRAARLLLPAWLDRGEGYFVSTASAAGLLTQIGSAPYAMTKHAAVAFAEWMSVTYGDQGIRASCLCPMGVNTTLFRGGAEDIEDAPMPTQVVAAAGNVLEPDDVAEVVMDTLREERFLVLPHPEVLTFFQRKASDYDRWLGGMRRLQRAVAGAG
jgi:NAD(P)-dependent dehydrogenase (short-subunit alcohol dehydrogenase family)